MVCLHHHHCVMIVKSYHHQDIVRKCSFSPFFQEENQWVSSSSMSVSQVPIWPHWCEPQLTLSHLRRFFFSPKIGFTSMIHCQKPMATHKIVHKPQPPIPTINNGHHTIGRACCGAWLRSSWQCITPSTSYHGAKRLATIFPLAMATVTEWLQLW